MTTTVSSKLFAVQDPRTGEVSEKTAEDLRAIFERDGVVLFPEFYSEEDLAAANRELEIHFAPIEQEAREMVSVEQRANKYGCDVIPWNPVGDGNQVFTDLREEPRLVAATEAVLGEGFSAPSSLVMYSVGGGRGQAWHQDCPAGEQAGFNLNRLIYNADVTLADGAIVFVPGSHKSGRIPPGDHQEPMDGEVALEPRAGTLVFLHGHVFHRVTPNQNRKPRVSINYRAYPKGVDPDVNCIGVYRNAEVNFCDKRKNHDGTPADNDE